MRVVDAKPVLAGSKVKWTLEQIEQTNQQRVRLDWLRFTVPLEAMVARERTLEGLTAADVTVQEGFDLKARQALAADPAYSTSFLVSQVVARSLCRMLDCGFSVGPAEDKGMDFYSARTPIVHNSAVVGFVMAGSRKQEQASTVHVNLFGAAMLAIPIERLEVIRSFVAHAKGWLTRVDLAVDVWRGRSITEMNDAYLGGEFDQRGKRPSQRNAGSWLVGHSRTFYVGKRDTGKELRVYEKGHEQFGTPELATQHGCNDWLRYEVEVRNNHRVIDLDVLTRPADYFAGAYAFCARLLAELDVEAEATRIKTDPEVKDVTALAAVTKLVRWVSNTGGASLVALFELGGDLLVELVDANRHRVARRLKPFSAADVSNAFKQVAARMAPASVPSLIGA